MSNLAKSLAAGLLVVGATAALAEKWDFKGLELGSKSSVGDLQQRFNLKCVAVSPPGVGQFCQGRTTLLDWPAELKVNLDADDYVFKISVQYRGDPLKQFDAPKAMIAKYGPPSKKSGAAYEWTRRTQRSYWKIFFDPSKLELSVYRLDKPLSSNPAMTLNPKAKTDL